MMNSRSDTTRLNLGLFSYVVMLIAGVTGFCYVLIQPTRLPNPGMAAYKPPPGIAIYPRTMTFDRSANADTALLDGGPGGPRLKGVSRSPEGRRQGCVERTHSRPS